MGLHTVMLVSLGATVIATDISERLKVLNKRLKCSLNAEATRVADMEKLLFEDLIFDFVVRQAV